MGRADEHVGVRGAHGAERVGHVGDLSGKCDGVERLEAGRLDFLLGALTRHLREGVIGVDEHDRLRLRLQRLEHRGGGRELARRAREQPEYAAASLREDQVGAAAGLHHDAAGRFGDRAGRKHDVAAEGAEEEAHALVHLLLDQRGRARRITGIVEQVEGDAILLSADVYAAHLLVDELDGAVVAELHIEAGLGRGAGHGHRSAEADHGLLRGYLAGQHCRCERRAGSRLQERTSVHLTLRLSC
ncbi:MAG: hypothetical protein M5U07_03045 [Xanthobacteraceae bacterium]|nr:hypothetical protein [Xanthobacteraceae bacterium]